MQRPPHGGIRVCHLFASITALSGDTIDTHWPWSPVAASAVVFRDLQALVDFTRLQNDRTRGHAGGLERSFLDMSMWHFLGMSLRYALGMSFTFP